MNQISPYLICLLILSCQIKNHKNESSKENQSNLTVETHSLDTLLNTKDYLALSNKNGMVKVIDENDVDKFPTFEYLIGYQGKAIIGKNLDYNDVKIYKKYLPNTFFKDFPAKIYKGELAEPDFSTDPEAKRFITRIKNECKNGINFAGHYTLVTWGCGSPCQSSVVVNRKTGKIFSGFGTALGSKFRKDSKMIITNVGAIDTTTHLIKVCAYCNVNHKIWTGEKFEELE